jgi:hypothetical protein
MCFGLQHLAETNLSTLEFYPTITQRFISRNYMDAFRPTQALGTLTPAKPSSRWPCSNQAHKLLVFANSLQMAPEDFAVRISTEMNV